MMVRGKTITTQSHAAAFGGVALCPFCTPWSAETAYPKTNRMPPPEKATPFPETVPGVAFSFC